MTTTRDRSLAHETRCSKIYGAKLNPNSGATLNHELKGDLRHDHLVFECKCTTFNSITITRGITEKVRKQAALLMKRPILELEFQDTNPEIAHEAWAAFERDFAAELLKTYEDAKQPALPPTTLLSILSNYLSKDQREDLQRAIRQARELKGYNVTPYELMECLN